MHRIPPKPSLEKMPSYTSDIGLAVKEYQQYGGFHRLPQTKERIKSLLLKFPLGIELGKFATKYQEAFGEELVPQVFGFPNLVEMLRSLYEMMDMRPKVARERKVVIAKSPRGKGSDTLHKTDKKQKQEKSHLLRLLKERFCGLLEMYPHGLYVEKIGMAYKMKYREELVPQTFGFPYMGKMLQSLQDFVEVKVKKPEEMKWILYLKSTKRKSDKTKPEKKVTPSATPLHDVVEAFLSIINNLGGIEVDTLISEYEARTGQKLNVQELGFVSLPNFLSQMSEVLKTLKKDDKIILVDSTVSFEQPGESQDLTSTVAEEADTHSDTRALINLRQLLEEFPCGLRLDELYAAYEGFYGMSQEDLNYEKHGYGSLETLLAARPNVVTLLNYQGSVYVLPSQPFKSPKPDQINSTYTGEVVGQDKRYSVVGKLPPGRVEVLVGEVYTPQLFWVMHYGEDTSLELDRLMDRMLDFYGSSLGERYRLQERQVTNHMPVAALYKPDDNFYRAFVLSVEDLKTVKLFFVDYGTVCISTYDCLHLLHRKFFALPAQAIKCSLYGVLPADRKHKWSRKCSKRFLVMVQNQRLMAEVMDEQITTVIQLWDTSHGEDISIGELLVREGLAALGNPCDEISDPCTPETVATSAKLPVAQITVRDLEVVPSAVSFMDVQASHVTSTQEQPSEGVSNTALYMDIQGSSVASIQKQAFEAVPNTALYMDVHGSSVVSIQKQAFEAVPNRASHMNVQTSSVTSTQEQPFEGVPNRALYRNVQISNVTSTQEQASEGSLPSTREAQTNTVDLEAILNTVSDMHVQESSVASTQEHPSGGSLPCTKKAEANAVDLSPIERSSCMLSFEMAAADSHYLVSSTPKQSLSSPPSNSCKCMTEQYTQSRSDGVFLNDNFLVQPLDVTLNWTLRIIQMDSISYVLDVDLPHVRHDQVDHLGITLRKESDQDIYLSLVESGFDILEPSGKFRPSIVIYPFRHLPAILAHSGYYMDGYCLPKDVEVKESIHGNISTELLRMEEKGYGNIPSMETSGGSSLHSGSVESRTFYRHGAQVEPLRRPYTASEFGHKH